MTRALVLACALACATAAPAADPWTAASWPKDVPLKLALPSGPRDRKPPDIRKFASRDADTGLKKGAAGAISAKLPGAGEPGAASPRPAASARPPAMLAAIKELERLQKAANTRLIELTQASGDLLRVLLSTGAAREQLLMPLLLFLAERGVIEKAEVQTYLDAPDPDPLLRRLAERLASVHQELEALSIRRYLAEK